MISHTGNEKHNTSMPEMKTAELANTADPGTIPTYNDLPSHCRQQSFQPLRWFHRKHLLLSSFNHPDMTEILLKWM